MLNIRKKVSGILCAAMLLGLSTNSSASGIPTLDAASLAQAIESVMYLEHQLNQLKTSYTTQLSQYETQVNVFKNMTGSRGIGSLIDLSSFTKLIPSNINEVIDAVAKNGEGGLPTEALSVMNRSGFIRCSLSNATLQDYCMKSTALQALRTYVAENSVKRAETLKEKVGEVQSKIDATNGDTKYALDMNAFLKKQSEMFAAERLRMEQAERQFDLRQKELETAYRQHLWSMR